MMRYNDAGTINAINERVVVQVYLDCFGNPLSAQLMRFDSLDTTMLYICGTKQDLQHDVEKIAWT